MKYETEQTNHKMSKIILCNLEVYTQLYSILFVIIIISLTNADHVNHKVTELITNRTLKLPPCDACKMVVESFINGIDQTARNHFGGGNTAWEEERLGTYATSELRLIEIQEMMCAADRAYEQCVTLVEAWDQYLEDWWFISRTQNPDLEQFLCVETVGTCSPVRNTITSLASGKVNAENEKSKLNLTGTAFDSHHSSDLITKDSSALEDPRSTLKNSNLCSSYPSLCQKDEFCVAKKYTYSCEKCDPACDGCSGSGPGRCLRCAPDFLLEDNACVQNKTITIRIFQLSAAIQLATYIGLLTETGVIFQKRPFIAVGFWLSIAAYVAFYEYIMKTMPRNEFLVILLFIGLIILVKWR